MTRQQKIKLSAVIVAGGLFVLLIEKTNPALIAARVWEVGWGFFWLVLISGVRNLIRSVAWYHSIDRAERNVSFWDAFAIRMAGEAVTDLTVLGPLLGDTVKAIALSRWVAVWECASSLVIENLAYCLAASILIISGMALFVSGYAIPMSYEVAGGVILFVLLVASASIGIIVKKKYRLASKAVEWLKHSKFKWGATVGKHEEQVRRFEENLYTFYERNPGGSALIVALELMAGMVGVVEAYAILLLTKAPHTTFLDAFIIEAVYRIVVLFFGFIPMRIGVDEGGTALILKALGHTAAEGVSMAIIRKIRTLFWVGLGLLLGAHYSISLKSRPAITASK